MIQTLPPSLTADFAERQGAYADTPAMFQPHKLGDLELKNRVIVSSMDMYSAPEGMPGNFHLVHLGALAMGGAGLVMTEMVCVSAAGRITPGCSGIYTEKQGDSWREVVDFVHNQSTAKDQDSGGSLGPQRFNQTDVGWHR